MLTNDIISARVFCAHHNVDYSFLTTLQQYGLIEIVSDEDSGYIPEYQLPRLEQMLRLHFELEINPEGIDAIFNLLDKVQNMQSEISQLKNRLEFYEQ